MSGFITRGDMVNTWERINRLKEETKHWKMKNGWQKMLIKSLRMENDALKLENQQLKMVPSQIDPQT